MTTILEPWMDRFVCKGCGFWVTLRHTRKGCLSLKGDPTREARIKPDMVNHPPHYTNHPSGIEPIEITRHMNFNLGNALKYIMRADYKGKPIEDLKKAIWYLNDEIAKREKTS